MKKILIFIMAVMLTIGTATAQYGPTKFTDNVSVEVKGGVTTPMSDFYEGVSPVVGVQVDKYVTPWLGFGVDANTLIANPYGSSNPHTAFDLVNVNGLAKVNVRNVCNYDGTRKFFEPVVFTGIGWGHRTCNEFANRNYMTFKSGVELNFSLDKQKAWAVRVTPAVVWGPASDLKLDKRNGAFELTAGVAYRFKNKDGNRHYTKIRVYDQAEVDRLTLLTNELRGENHKLKTNLRRTRKALSDERARKPKEVEVLRVDTVMLMPDVQFRQGSKNLEETSEATVVKMAKYMKSKPNKTFTLMGYASVEGSTEYNEQLSLWRAETLRDKLVEYGVNADSLKAVGYGETDKFSEEIRELNRIVVIEE